MSRFFERRATRALRMDGVAIFERRATRVENGRCHNFSKGERLALRMDGVTSFETREHNPLERDSR